MIYNIIYSVNFLSVVPPVITDTVLGNADAPQFTITTDPFSDRYGGLGIYKVVVVLGSPIDTASIIDRSLQAQGSGNPFK